MLTFSPLMHLFYALFECYLCPSAQSKCLLAQNTWAEVSNNNAQQDYMVFEMLCKKKTHDLAVFTSCWPAKPKGDLSQWQWAYKQFSIIHCFIQLHDTINSPMTVQWTLKMKTPLNKHRNKNDTPNNKTPVKVFVKLAQQFPGKLMLLLLALKNPE